MRPVPWPWSLMCACFSNRLKAPRNGGLCQKYYCQTDTKLTYIDELNFKFTLGQISFPFVLKPTVHR
jgi:hypothetical protein